MSAIGQPRYQRDGDPRTSGPGFGVTLHHDLVDQPTRWRKPAMVFVCSMSDLFHPEIPDEFISQVFTTMNTAGHHTFQVLTKRSRRLAELAPKLTWTPNIWCGVSVENDRYTFRIDHLRQVPAAVRFLSIEPLLGPIDQLNLDGIGWMIVGGESGPNHRPPQADWVRALRDQAVTADVPFFFKQWGGRTPKAGGRHLDDHIWDQYPHTTTSVAVTAAT